MFGLVACNAFPGALPWVVQTCSVLSECAVVFIVVVVVSGHPHQAPCSVDVLPGPTGCDLVSKVRLNQSANPVVVRLGLVSRVVRSSWSRGVFVHQCLHHHKYGVKCFFHQIPKSESGNTVHA